MWEERLAWDRLPQQACPPESSLEAWVPAWEVESVIHGCLGAGRAAGQRSFLQHHLKDRVTAGIKP